jgi:DNA repair protein RadC
MAVLLATIPLHDRPRERLLARGVEALADSELLALVLRSGTRGMSALDLASALLAEYGSIDALGIASPEELAMRKGIGPAKAASVVAAFRMANSHSTTRPPALRTALDVAEIALRELKGARRERVLVLVCDASNRLRCTSVVSEGSVDRSLVPVREILNAVLRRDGRAFALAHNHPSGQMESSDADRKATDEVKAAARITGLRFLGHVIVSGVEWCSVS